MVRPATCAPPKKMASPATVTTPENHAGTAKKEEAINGEAGSKPIKKMGPLHAASFGHSSDDRWQNSICRAALTQGTWETRRCVPLISTS